MPRITRNEGRTQPKAAKAAPQSAGHAVARQKREVHSIRTGDGHSKSEVFPEFFLSKPFFPLHELPGNEGDHGKPAAKSKKTDDEKRPKKLESPANFGELLHPLPST
jgi:hypothetical protein